MRTTATFTAYLDSRPDMNGPAGEPVETSCAVEVIGFRHDRHGITAARVKTAAGNSWWVSGDSLDDIEVARIA